MSSHTPGGPVMGDTDFPSGRAGIVKGQDGGFSNPFKAFCHLYRDLFVIKE